MSWASLGNNQTVSYNNLQDAVNNGVFTLKNTIPVSSKQTTKGEAEFFVNIDPILKGTEQLVVKSNLVANNSTTTTTTTIPSLPTRYALAGTTGDLYISNNGGFNWGTVPFFNGITVDLVKVSSTGQYMLVTGYLIGTNQRILYLSSNSGSTWTSLGTISGAPSGTPNDVAISDNGQYIVYVSGDVYISSNSGASFSTAGSPGVSFWRGVAMSSTGQYITAVSSNSQIWVSSNFGVSYTAKTGLTSWEAVAMSKDGRYQIAGRGSIWRSTDFGVNWTNTGQTITNGASALALSGDGQYGLAFRKFGGLEIFRSTNFGANWSFLTLIGNSGNGNWRCVSISPDNGVQLVGANGNVWPTNEIWRSGNGGILFTAVSGTNIGWDSIAVGNQL
jgi:hypothetical protein